jgi:hypothetical protein
MMMIAAALLLAASVVSGQPTVSYADAIIPQLPAGCGWTFSIVLMNLSPRDIGFTVNFWRPPGVTNVGDVPQPREIAIQGRGRTGSVTSVIPMNGSYTINADESVRSSNDCNGWAEVNSEEAVGGYVVLNQKAIIERQQTIGGIAVKQVTEFSVDATVPLASRFASRFLVPFDTTSYVNAVALVNPSFQTAADVLVTYRDENGMWICDEARRLKPGEQQTYELRAPVGDDVPPVCDGGYSSLKGLRGVVEVSSPNLELSGVAFRFGALGFVSYPAQTSVGR